MSFLDIQEFESIPGYPGIGTCHSWISRNSNPVIPGYPGIQLSFHSWISRNGHMSFLDIQEFVIQDSSHFWISRNSLLKKSKKLHTAGFEPTPCVVQGKSSQIPRFPMEQMPPLIHNVVKLILTRFASYIINSRV